jgi:tRNA pseudouridine38-40 synthase
LWRSDEGRTVRIAIGVEYDGQHYSGWQSQAEGCTVQDTLQHALSQIAGETISVIAAGRTDTGIHALEQVVHFDTNIARPNMAWVRGVNTFLPHSIAVLWAHTVPEEFHARFSAQARSYRYVLANRAIRSAVQHGKVGWFHLPLDVAQMRMAAHLLVGEHDFSAFRSSQCQAKSPLKNLSRLDIHQQGDTIVFELTAGAFLHHMVRNIVGCLVYVGKGKYPPEWLGEVLAGRERSLAAPTFAPDGLYLTRIKYDEKWGLPQRQDQGCRIED